MAHFDNENYNDLSDAEYIKKFEADLKELDGNISIPSVENRKDDEFIEALKERLLNKTLPETFDSIARTYFEKKLRGIYINIDKAELTGDGITEILKRRTQPKNNNVRMIVPTGFSVTQAESHFTDLSQNKENKQQHTEIFIINTANVQEGARNGSHWVTVAMNVNNDNKIIQYRYLDPKQNVKDGDVENYKESFGQGTKLLEEAINRVFADFTITRVKETIPARQLEQDDIHCGDWCILYALELEKNGFEADITTATEKEKVNIETERKSNITLLESIVAQSKTNVAMQQSSVKQTISEDEAKKSDNVVETVVVSDQDQKDDNNVQKEGSGEEIVTENSSNKPDINVKPTETNKETNTEAEKVAEENLAKFVNSMKAMLAVLEEKQKAGLLTARQVLHIKQAIYLEAIKDPKLKQPPKLEEFYQLDNDISKTFVKNHDNMDNIVSILERGKKLLEKSDMVKVFDNAVSYLNERNIYADNEVITVSKLFDNVVQHNTKKMDPKGPYRGIGVCGKVKNDNGEISFIITEVFKESVLYKEYKDKVKLEPNGTDATSVEIVTINGIAFAEAIKQLMFKEESGTKETDEAYQQRTGISDLAALRKEIGDDFSVNNQKFVEWAVMQLIRGQNIGSDAHKDQANKQLGIQIKSTNPNNNNQLIKPINHQTRIFDSETHKPYTMNAEIAREQRKALVSKLQDSETIKTYLSSSDQTKVDALAKDLQSFLEKANNAYKQPKEPGKKTSQENHEIKQLAKEVFNEVKDSEKMEESFVQELAKRREKVKKLTTQEKKGNPGVTVHI